MIVSRQPPAVTASACAAPQVANADFFLKMIPLFDAGDDVGMVLSPQAFHNIDVRCDVFNHSNVQFWEYAQPGYDALPFISCTGGAFHRLCTHTVRSLKASVRAHTQNCAQSDVSAHSNEHLCECAAQLHALLFIACTGMPQAAV